MARIEQGAGQKGSLYWIQRAIAENWPTLNEPILVHIPVAHSITWLSPLAGDKFAEYRDADFFRVLKLAHLEGALAEFWPQRGPQWDALGVTDRGQVLLVEAKAHIGEMCSPGTAAGKESRRVIAQRLGECAERLGAAERAELWPTTFYQLANRIAHLEFLRRHNVDAYLVLVNFLNASEMAGPSHKETWQAALQIANHVLGLGRRHPMSRYIIEAFPDAAPFLELK